jgi:hypothetical protein
MRRGSLFWKWTIVIVLGTTITTVVLPGHRTVTLGAGVMAMLAVVLVEMSGAAYRLAASSPSAWERVRHVHENVTQRPADLERIERRLGWGRYSTGDFNYRVRPMLRRLAAHRLRETHRVDIEERPNEARPHVGDELWELVIAKQPPDSERVIGTAEIARMVDEIERI